MGVQMVLLSQDIGLKNRVLIRHLFDNLLNPLFRILYILFILTLL